MRTQLVLSLAVGFVAASPCKQLTSAVTILPESFLTSSTTEEIPASIETSVTETFTFTTVDDASTDVVSTTLTASFADTTTFFTVETSATETSTSVGTTSDGFSSTTVTASSADTTTLFTTETSAETTEQTTTLTLSETTTAEMTTTTEVAEPTGFFIIAGPGQALGEKLESSTREDSVVVFNTLSWRGDAYRPRRFVVDDTTGVLLNEGTPMCAFFNFSDKTRASVSLCSQERNVGGSSYITCSSAPSAGNALVCTAVKLDCQQIGPSNQRCEVAEEDQLWNNQFFLQHYTSGDLAGESNLFFGRDNLAETFQSSYSTLETVDLFVDFVEISMPPA
ncbi:hypothetical protein NW768_007260 [Fusarium equiseti]|uniref:Uncharacterized protein n=1 Tax=Fusarium equiseti TaxID=61235 RepID=A0ABQ8RAI5_FUSEQ|nr:hypothetical protein NW768_007260 [Fusarium equiseti]